jgi:hypothetical protein
MNMVIDQKSPLPPFLRLLGNIAAVNGTGLCRAGHGLGASGGCGRAQLIENLDLASGVFLFGDGLLVQPEAATIAGGAHEPWQLATAGFIYGRGG